MPAQRRITVSQFRGFKSKGRKVSMLTAYDFPTAQLLDQAGVEGILVGDSLAMVVQGHDSTLPVTLDQIIYHAEIVGRAVERALVVVDLPFPTYRLGTHKAIESAARIIKETRGQAVKLECGAEQAETIEALVNSGIPVMAHVGLSPQSVHVSGYRVQRDGERLLKDARAAQDAGAFAVVVECVPPGIASELTNSLDIPTIGIGAGTDCDGQILVTHDLLGLTSGYVPSFVREYADMRGMVTDAVTRFREDVRSGSFPGDDETFK